MKILINTDKNISGTEEMRTKVGVTIANTFDKYRERITRIEAKISDEDGDKNSINDKKCVLEVRIKGMEPIAVTGLGNTIENALDIATNKMKATLDTTIGRLGNH